VYYLLGERFDQDPFLLFELRGRSQQEIAASLSERRAVKVEEIEGEARLPEITETFDTPGLEESLERFWTYDASGEELRFDIGYPEVEMALLKRLGVPGFQGMVPQSFWAQMVRVYDGVTERALQVAYADAASSEQ
jgi:uncharacterized Zn finger protein